MFATETLTVALSETEWRAAYSLGLKREEKRIAGGRWTERPTMAHSKAGDTWHRNGHGAVAEYAFARACGKTILADWVQTRALVEDARTVKCDIGHDCEIRSSNDRNARLLMRKPEWKKADNDHTVYILAIIDRPELRTVRFVGWSTLHQIRTTGDYMTRWPEPTWALEQQWLYPINTIPKERIYGPALHSGPDAAGA